MVVELARKVCMIGDFGVGKSSLVGRFVRQTFSEKYLTTVGVKVDSKVVHLADERVLKLVIWDLAGKADLDKLNKGYVRGAHGLLLVADGTRSETVTNALNLLDEVQGLIPGVPAVMAMNKSDLRARWEMQPADIMAMRPGLRVHETSALDGSGVEAAFHDLAKETVAA